MKKGHLDDLLTAVDAFKDAAGATIMDVRKFLTSLGRRIAPKTITKNLKSAARRGLVQLSKRRYYPVSMTENVQVVTSRRGRRRKKGKPGCPCFSKARYHTAARRSLRRRRRLGGYGVLVARRRPRSSRRRRTRRRTALQDSQTAGARLMQARRRGRRSSRRRRRAAVRTAGVDNIRKAKAKSKKTYPVRPIKIEKVTSDHLDETENPNEESEQIDVEDDREVTGECKSDPEHWSDRDNRDQASDPDSPVVRVGVGSPPFRIFTVEPEDIGRHINN